ncbi:MAG: ABC transporter ATP-binding protein [SAR202 cluster bacterium]|nr:ABC transporter ATP-binding protein [SAR202 cluster bacterium]
MAHPLIVLTDATKVYRLGKVDVHALDGVTLAVEKGEFLAIMGASGSGKSTMMNLLGCLDVPTTGAYLLDGEDVSRMSDNKLAEVRNCKIGFVFQQYNLLPKLTAVANVELPLVYGNVADRRARALEALGRVGLAKRAGHKPSELSGGEQQRVGIARALVKSPAILLADEPTGNLDSRSSGEIMAFIQKLNDEDGITIILVTHEPDIAAHARRVVTMRDGKVIRDQLQEPVRAAVPAGARV